jgi:rubrerythrin
MATKVFDVADLMDKLAKQEADGYTFYETVAASVDGEKVKKVFMKLAKDERKHEAFYKKQMKKYAGKKYELNSKDAAFIKVLLMQPSAIAIAAKSVTGKVQYSRDQALAIAEKLERDTIVFLSHLVTLNEEFANEKAFVTALKEEKEHLRMILDSSKERLSSALML